MTKEQLLQAREMHIIRELEKAEKRRRRAQMTASETPVVETQEEIEAQRFVDSLII